MNESEFCNNELICKALGAPAGTPVAFVWSANRELANEMELIMAGAIVELARRGLKEKLTDTAKEKGGKRTAVTDAEIAEVILMAMEAWEKHCSSTEVTK